MKFVLAISLFLLPLFSRAEETTTSTTSANAATSSASTKHDWTTEGQLATSSNSIQPTFGPALFYNVDDNNQVGFKVLAPVGKVSEGTTSLVGAYRYFFGRAKTALFGEGTLSANWYNSANYYVYGTSLGTHIGVVHRLTEDIAFGGIGGTEWTRTRIVNSVAFNDPNSIYIWPVIAVFGAIGF